MKIDRILDFLFRSRLGHLTLMGGLLTGACLFSGCFCLDVCSCACDDTCNTCLDNCGCDDSSQNCWAKCDDSCNDCFMDACGGEDCAVTSCLFGDGCITNCGNCVVDCGGCNSTICTDCQSGCIEDGCGFSCFNCTTTCDGAGYSTSTQTITIRYIDTNGNSIDSKTWEIGKRDVITQGYQLSMPSTDITDYYEFQGYYLDEKFMQPATGVDGKWSTDRNINEINYIYGKLVERNYGEEYEVEFNVEPQDLGVTITDPVTLTIGKTISYWPTAPEVDGYKFQGWRRKDGTVLTNAEILQKEFHLREWGYVNSASVTVTAVYAPIEVTLTLDLGDGKTAEQKTSYDTHFSYIVGKYEDEHSAEFEREGKQFVGWSKKAGTNYTDTGEWFSSDSNEAKNYLLRQENETFYAVYRYEITLVKHHLDGSPAYGIADKTETVVKLEEERIVLDRLGNVDPYRFDGWFLDADYRSGIDYNYTFKLARTDDNQLITKYDIYAGWHMETHWNLTYYYGEYGTDDKINSDYDVTDDPYPLRSLRPKEGYTPVGWCRNVDLSDTPFMELPPNTYGDLILYPKYEPKQYTIHMVVQGGVTLQNPDKKVTYDAMFELPVPTRTEMDFNGWKVVESGRMITDALGKSLKPFTMANLGLSSLEDNKIINVMPEWGEHEYTVQFKLDADGNAEAEVRRKSGEQIGDITSASPGFELNPTRRGYTFDGWFWNGTEYNSGLTVTQDMTFVAKFTPRTYQIVLKAAVGGVDGKVNGEEETTITVTYGQTVTLPKPTCTDINKIFMGWRTRESGGNPVTNDYGNWSSSSGFTIPTDSYYTIEGGTMTDGVLSEGAKIVLYAYWV